MKIDSSNIGMESARNYQSAKTSYRRFSVTEYRGGMMELNTNLLGNGNNRDDKSGENSADGGSNLYTLQDWQNDLMFGAARIRFQNSGTQDADAAQESSAVGSSVQIVRSDSVSDRDNTWNEFRQLTIRYIFQLLFGERTERYHEMMEKYGLTVSDEKTADTQQQSAGIRQLSTGAGQFQYTEDTYTYEQETTAFSTVGTVRTSDGREICFNVDVGMSREFAQTVSQDLNLSFRMCDPLVINLDVDVAQLSDQKFYFDIDGDGEKDEISQLGKGSGYLALDQNGDGVIGDGSELFGTKSGNGFADLAKYDEDGNGWIDENDAIWTKLQIWTKDENGKDVLYRLAEKGVGAICLQHAATDFTLKGADGRTNGAIRNTGVFLYEKGNVGTLQHVDVAKYEHTA